MSDPARPLPWYLAPGWASPDGQRRCTGCAATDFVAAWVATYGQAPPVPPPPGRDGDAPDGWTQIGPDEPCQTCKVPAARGPLAAKHAETSMREAFGSP